MGFAKDLLHHPRRLWLRQALFQVHLWAGVLLSLYLIAIALSGSVLVYKDELTRWSLPSTLHSFSPGQMAMPEAVMAHFAQQQPGGIATSLQFPSPVLPAFLLEGKSSLGRPVRWIGDPLTAALYPAPRTWLDEVHDLHYDLLLPAAWGMQVNSLGAAVLLLLSLTGIVLWWPGVRLWARGLRVHVRGSWRRLNYDLHNAIGFWTLGLVLAWAVSGVYFGFYRQVTAVVASVSPLRGMAAPRSLGLASPALGQTSTLAEVIAAAEAASPGGLLWSVSDPSLRGTESYILIDRRAPGDFSHRDIVRVRSADAHVTSIWHYGECHTLGDWVLWSMHPMHFGTLWGPEVKVLWAGIGVSLAALTATGLLMYWNRFLRRRLGALRSNSQGY